MFKNNKKGWGLSSAIIMIFLFICCLLISIYYINKIGFLKNPEKISNVTNDQTNIVDTTYSDLENEVKNASKIYVNKEHIVLGRDTFILTVDRLINLEYLEYLEDPDKIGSTCSGYAEGELINNKEVYKAYINCSSYYTKGYIKRKDSK